MYLVENTVRNIETRGHRAKAPARHRFKQFVAGQRVLRGRKLPLTEEQFAAAKDQLKDMLLAGTVAIILPDGQRVSSLPTGEIVMGGQKLPAGSDPFSGKAAPKAAPKVEAAPAPVEEEAPAPEPEEDEHTKKKAKKWRTKKE